MRVKIEIDERLVRQAMRATEAETNEAVVEDALRLLIQTKRHCGIPPFARQTRSEGRPTHLDATANTI